MAAGSVAGTPVTSTETSTTTPHTVSLPSNIAADENLVVAFHISDHTATVSVPAEWSKVFDQTEGSSLARDSRLVVAVKKADGGEGSSITVTTDFSTTSAHAAARGQDLADPTVTAPESASKTTGSDSNPDPGSISPSGGADDYLIFAVYGQAGEADASSAPSGYSNLTTTNCGAQNSEDEASVAFATRQLSGASSEDPGAFTSGYSTRWLATTVAFYPASGTTNSLPILTPTNIGV